MKYIYFHYYYYACWIFIHIFCEKTEPLPFSYTYFFLIVHFSKIHPSFKFMGMDCLCNCIRWKRRRTKYIFYRHTNNDNHNNNIWATVCVLRSLEFFIPLSSFFHSLWAELLNRKWDSFLFWNIWWSCHELLKILKKKLLKHIDMSCVCILYLEILCNQCAHNIKRTAIYFLFVIWLNKFLYSVNINNTTATSLFWKAALCSELTAHCSPSNFAGWHTTKILLQVFHFYIGACLSCSSNSFFRDESSDLTLWFLSFIIKCECVYVLLFCLHFLVERKRKQRDRHMSCSCSVLSVIFISYKTIAKYMKV